MGASKELFIAQREREEAERELDEEMEECFREWDRQQFEEQAAARDLLNDIEEGE